MRSIESKTLAFNEIEAVVEKEKKEGKKIVTTNGCFDLLHWGHIQYLTEAKTLGDILICGINSNDSVKGLKGSHRPLCDQQVRAGQVAALESVDYVTIFDESTPEVFLQKVRPDIHVKGGDYKLSELPERVVVEKYGGKIALLSLVKGYSTTELIEKLKSLS